MRVAHVNSDPGIAPGRRKGAAVHVEAVRAAMAELGADVVAVDAKSDPEVLAALEAAHAAAPLGLVYQRYALERFASFEFASERGLPFVLEVNSPLAEEARRWRGRDVEDYPVRERAMLGGSTAVLAVSTQVARWAVERGADPDRTLVRANGVDSRLFRPRTGAGGLRARLFPQGAFVVGFHGRLRPWHDFDRIVEALARLVAEDLPVHLLAIGEGPFEEPIAKRLPGDRAVIVPWIPHAEAATYVACFDALALSYSPLESCYFSPLKLFEAMACGAVPVVPALGDLPLFVAHEECGLVFPPGDAGALADALARLMREPELHRRLSLAARARAEANSWQRIAREVLDLADARRPA